MSSLSTTVRDTSQAASGLGSSWMGDRYGSVVLSEPRTISSGGRVERTLAFLALDVEMWKSDIQRQAMSLKKKLTSLVSLSGLPKSECVVWLATWLSLVGGEGNSDGMYQGHSCRPGIAYRNWWSCRRDLDFKL